MTPAEHWARCRPWIVAALETGPGFETIEDVERHVGDGGYHFWAGKDCALITTFENFNNRRALSIKHGGGNLEELLGMYDALKTYALANGCDMLISEGREGWKRIMQRMGAKVAWVAMYKDLKA